ncbi:hypothetical protein [Okeania sp. KiyG1]|uniref:hypothetical protein n=1 Tax=Okeania sp. KiyG1 TaxID=2720165 RepID=UPI0019239737|nr:hypothetical protein [Okeania sp. KiyG1]
MLNTTLKSKFQAYLPLKKALSRVALGLATLLFTVIFCVATPTASASEIDDYISQYQPVIETLHGLQVTEKTVTILVTSTGCTKKEDFIAVLDKYQPPTATFIRLIPDFCRAASRAIPITFSLQEVGATEFKVANTVDPSPSF